MRYDAPALETGCYIDGHHGHYGSAEVILLAADLGYNTFQDITSAKEYLAGGDVEWIMEMADDAEHWLNENIAAPEHYFGWFDGEFFYQTAEWFED